MMHTAQMRNGPKSILLGNVFKQNVASKLISIVYTVLHMFRQVLFGAENQSSKKG